MVNVVRYEAKWSPDSVWKECTRVDYEAIIQTKDPRFEARALGVIVDEGNLLLRGPEGFDSWYDAATNERLLRINLKDAVRDALKIALSSESNSEQKIEAICVILERANNAAR